MKKLHLIVGILLIALTISSCSSDNDKNETTSKQELLIGQWKKIKIAIMCSSGSEIGKEYSTCQQKGSITFNADGTYTDIPYIEFNNECMVDGESNGTWKIVDNELYITKSGNDTGIKITFFEISANTLKIGGYSEPCDGEENPSIEYLEYSKI